MRRGGYKYRLNPLPLKFSQPELHYKNIAVLGVFGLLLGSAEGPGATRYVNLYPLGWVR